MDLKGFERPETILRPAPFWAINDRISSEEIAAQMESMIGVGLSGGFFHSRHGLTTRYMGDDWFSAMNAALEVAKEKDAYLWLYDEDLWPSGNAGGQVAGMKNEYRAASLDGILVPPGEPAPKLTEDQAIRHCYAIKSRVGLELKDIESVPLDRISDAVIYERLFLIRTYKPKIGWWSGESYANLLNPEAMRQFVEMTHEVYYQKLGQEFGKRIPGIFTDEPQISNSNTGIAWYDGIPDVYADWSKRDFWADIPYMFFNGAQARKIRLFISRTLLRQFVEAYSKPNFEWCDKHGLEYTGHYNAEDSFHSQIMCHAGGIMAHYRYQHAPGIDHLCRQIDGYYDLAGMLLTVKQASSAARQLGRKRVLTEIFGVTRHTNTFEDFKWLGDYDLVHGANFFVPHLSWYSAKGRRKRDYPPCWNYQQTYWKDLNPLNDYFTRVAHALTRGKAAVDIVMLHSIESAVAARTLGVEVISNIENNTQKMPLNIPVHDMQASGELDGLMRKSLESILTTGCDCDLGDEGYIEDLGSVRGDRFAIGEMDYRVVVLPPSTTWRPRTFQLLKDFVDNGGKAVVLGELPTELDCNDARREWVDFAGHANVRSVPCGVHEIQDVINEIAPRTFTLTDADGQAVPHTYVQRRIDGDQEIDFIVNSSQDAVRNYVLTFIGGRGKAIVEWDAVNGTCEKRPGVDIGEDTRLEFSLPPCGSVLLTLGGNVDAENAKKTALPLRESGSISLPKEFEFERVDPNVLVIDRMGVSYDGGKAFEPEEMEHRIRRGVLAHFGTEAMSEWQPWVAMQKRLFEGKGGEIVLRYEFLSDLDRPKSFAVIEDIGKGELFLNGIQVDVSNVQWQWDHAFGKVEITELVKKGENIMDFKVHYDFLTEVESAYIVGDFGVEMTDTLRGKIVAEPKSLKIGAWTRQGYPFYPGRMIYKTEIDATMGEAAVLRLIRPSGILYKVRVNGKDAGDILWRPYELEITGYLKSGVNQVEIEVVASMQNTWGPLHEKIGDDFMWCGPGAFEEDCFLREEMNIFPYGLLGGVELDSIQSDR